MGQPLRVHAFRGGSSFPLRVAVERGHFTRHGLDVRLSFTASSPELMEGLLAGTFDVVQAAPDNFVAWRQRTGRPIVVWYGASNGPISCVVRPEIGSLDDLRGASVAVDAPDTGWAPILMRILASAGITRDEVTQVATGATAQVFDALIAGRTPAAMLNEPWVSRAVAAGCRIAGDHRSVAPRLQTSAGASLEPWLDEHHDEAVAFLRAVVGATTWILDPDERDAAAGLLRDHLESSEPEAEALFARLATPDGGWPPSAYPDLEGIRSVTELRGPTITSEATAVEAHLRFDVYRRALGDSPRRQA